jgi:hypothetical protein
MRPVPIRFGRGRVRPIRIVLATAIALAGAAAIPAGLALAQPTNSGSVTETITTGVLSVTISTNSIALCSTASPLTFPNAECVSTPFTITNGTAPSDIDVQGYNAYPTPQYASDPGTSPPDWTLCYGDPTIAPAYNGPACGGSSGNGFTDPGQDQYEEATDSGADVNGSGTASGGQALSEQPQCDAAFDVSEPTSPDCAAASGQVQTEELGLLGPSASTDYSQTWQSQVQWTAVAQ